MHSDRGRYIVKAKNCVGEDECQLRVWFKGAEPDDMAERAEYRRTQKMYQSRHVKPQDEDEWGGELYHSKRLDKQKEYDHRYKLSWLSRIMSQTLAQGSTLRFVAFVDGKYPQYEWYHDGILLFDGRKYKHIVTKNGKGCLIINNVQPADSGVYKLIVKNYANSIECEARVTVYAYEYKNFEPPLFINVLSGNAAKCNLTHWFQFVQVERVKYTICGVIEKFHVCFVFTISLVELRIMCLHIKWWKFYFHEKFSFKISCTTLQHSKLRNLHKTENSWLHLHCSISACVSTIWPTNIQSCVNQNICTQTHPLKNFYVFLSMFNLQTHTIK
jgi:hypothetical protein